MSKRYAPLQLRHIALAIAVCVPTFSAPTPSCGEVPIIGQIRPPKRIHSQQLRRIGLLNFSELEYPAELKGLQLSGVAAVDLCFDAEGTVSRITVLQAPHEYIASMLTEKLSRIEPRTVPHSWKPRGMVVRWVFYFVARRGQTTVIDTSVSRQPAELAALRQLYGH